MCVDGARLPVYFAAEWRDIVGVWPLVLVASVAVFVRTALGTRVLGRLPERAFRKTLAVLLLGLGAYMVMRGGA